VVASPALQSARVNVCAGADGFARALGSLISNACEGDGARAASRVVLRLGAEAEVDAVSLEVADDGPGMAERELPRLVQPFQSTKPGHVGLGLYTARCILEASGGSVSCQNDPAARWGSPCSGPRPHETGAADRAARLETIPAIAAVRSSRATPRPGRRARRRRAVWVPSRRARSDRERPEVA
jgi:signal transduction histidine kinase